jgi:hypothetical protein
MTENLLSYIQGKGSKLNVASDSILRVLVYFDIFRYPLTAKEINSFIDQPLGEKELNTSLDELLNLKRIFKLDEFYSLQNDLSLAERRRKGNAYAEILLAKASKIAKLLYKFPYVRGISISGSLSKNFADENADIDYFIITKANRLWIARTLLILFRKNPFLKNRYRYYCMNYFIDDAEPVIEEKNIYTATELLTLMPMAGNGSLKKFFESNSWSFNYFPNKVLPVIEHDINFPDNWLKKFGELILNNRLGDWLDNYLLNLTRKRWKKIEEEHRLNIKGERLGMKIAKHYSKPNPIFFHDYFMEMYKNRIKEISKN